MAPRVPTLAGWRLTSCTLSHTHTHAGAAVAAAPPATMPLVLHAPQDQRMSHEQQGAEGNSSAAPVARRSEWVCRKRCRSRCYYRGHRAGHVCVCSMHPPRMQGSRPKCPGRACNTGIVRVVAQLAAHSIHTTRRVCGRPRFPICPLAGILPMLHCSSWRRRRPPCLSGATWLPCTGCWGCRASGRWRARCSGMRPSAWR